MPEPRLTSSVPPPTSAFQLDRSLATLQRQAAGWLEVPLGRKVEYLRSIARRTLEAAPALVGDALVAKGVDELWAGEDWVAGPLTQLRTVRFLIDTLEGIERTGRIPLRDRDISTRPDGQVVVAVTPADLYDRVLYPGLRAEVWLDPEVRREEVVDAAGAIYTRPESALPGVALVLGAGNVASIGPLDVIHKLFVEGHPSLLKFSPVNEYIGPHVEHAFSDLMADGLVRTAYGGADVGQYLVHHPDVTTIHITGAARSHDAIVWGPGEEGTRRKGTGAPLIDKPITSELGNVSPVIVVPGGWKERDLRFQAEHVATQMVQNNGFNCNAAKVLILHSEWPQRDAFLTHLRRALSEVPARPAYYPGSEDRWEQFVASHPSVEILGSRAEGVIPPALLLGLDPEFEHMAFTEEAFCSLAATTELGGGDAASFLERAVSFCNESLDGTLNATILVDPGAARELGPALDAAVAGLRYGAVGVNVWAAAAFVLGVTSWGAFPGHELDDIQSGIGHVRNARLLPMPQKSVVFAPFRMFPKPAWFVTHHNAHRTMARAAAIEAEPSVRRLPRLVASGLRG